MKLDITEVYFIQQAVDATTIKASDAGMVYALQVKVGKEFDRLRKLEERKQKWLSNAYLEKGSS